MAVGIACGSTGMQAALDLLEPLMADSVDFVRQGALIAAALVLMQQPESKARSPLLANLQFDLLVKLSSEVITNA